MLPISVLLPTRNATAFLPHHLAAMGEWLDLAQEVVVVDSFSDDGTLEIIKSRLRHPQLRILSHAPGLYESWNHGIQHLAAKYCYISTVGDTITREGLQHLADAAENLSCDIVMSKPEFCTLDGTRKNGPFWPVADMIQTLQVTAPRRISRWEFLTFAAAHGGTALLGSSASNLYRTATLNAQPFTTEFGRVSDSFWALRHSCRLNWGITPTICSTFLEHDRISTQAEKEAESRAKGADTVLWETVESELRSCRLNRAVLRSLNFFAMWDEMCGWLDYKRQFDLARRRPFPWVLNPRAWYLRTRRNNCARNLDKLKNEALLAMQTHAEPCLKEVWAF